MKSNTIRCAALGAALATVGLAGAQGTLTQISVDKAGPGVEVNISGSSLKKPIEKWTADGKTLTLEFVGARLPNWFPAQSVKDDGVNTVSVQRLKSKTPTVRVYLNTDGKSVAKIVPAANGWTVEVNKPVVVTPKPATKDPLAVPPLEPASKVLARINKPAAEPVTTAYKTENSAINRVKVSLDFVNTEVVQVLKAVTMQAGVNIVTSPDVQGTVTVALDNVTVKQALDMITTVSGLRYQQVGNSFIVTSADKFQRLVTQITGARSTMLDTRVIPIHSGQGPQIRASILSSIADDPSFGQVQMFLPDENYKLEKKQETGPEGESSSTDVEIEKAEKSNNAAAQQDDKGIKPASLKGMKDQYLVLVGPGELTEEIHDRIVSLDQAITEAHGHEYNKDAKLVRRSYRVQSPDVTANALVGAFSQHADEALINVDMFATPPVFQNQVVVLVGRESEVDRAEEMLKDLDYSGYGNDVYVYDVKYADPRGLREELVAQVKGLRVTIPTASAGNPSLYNPGKTVTDAAQEARHTGMVELDAGNNVQSTTAPSVGDTNIEKQGIDSPFKGLESTAVPMRLTLTGTQEQIEEAKAYLEQVDIMPKQVALELRVMELSREDALKFGLNWDLTTGGSVQFLGSSQSLPEGRRIEGSIVDGAFGLDVTATLDQIANRDNLIARPNLLAVDGRESELFVGDVIRYVEQIQATQNGTTVITGEVSVGVKLAVLPRIGDGHITMDLRPMVSFLTGFVPIPGGGQLPQTSVRMSQNTVTLRSGETIAIGGLIQDQEIKRLSKVPILGDLPVLGYLFRQEEKIRDRREVVFFLTAREVTESDERATAASPRHNAARNQPEILPNTGQPIGK